MDLSKITKSLNDLSKFDLNDLKNIDPEVVKNYLLTRRDVMLNVGISLVSLIAIIFFFITGHTNVSKFKKEAESLSQKSEALKTLTVSKEEIKNFIENAPQPVAADELIDMVNDLAIENDIQILTFSPAKQENRGSYILTSLNLQITSFDYVNIWSFIKDIEESEYALRVQSWKGSAIETARHDTEDSVLNFNVSIIIGSIEIISQ